MRPFFLSLLPLLAFFASVKKTDAYSLHMSSSPTTKPNGGLTHTYIQKMAQKRFHNDSSQPMKDKVAVITGSAGGIGSELLIVIYNLARRNSNCIRLINLTILPVEEKLAYYKGDW